MNIAAVFKEDALQLYHYDLEREGNGKLHRRNCDCSDVLCYEEVVRSVY